LCEEHGLGIGGAYFVVVPLILFAGPILCLVSWRKGDLANFGCLPRLVGPANNEKVHIPLTKCFALSDFGWGSLCPACSGPQATGARWVYMIKKKLQAASSKRGRATSYELASLE
jgi:hypothetical protein